MHSEVLDRKSKAIFEKLKNFPSFYLAGGTALALLIGHRISVDFDLFTDKEIPKDLLSKVEKIFKNFKIEVLVNNPEELTILLNQIKITFFKYPYKIISEMKKFQGVNILSVLEIGVTKAYALGRRATYKDYIDLHFILAGKFHSLKEIINLARKKYKTNFDPRLFLEQLVYLEDVEDEKIRFLKKSVTKKEIEKFFQKLIKNLV